MRVTRAEQDQNDTFSSDEIPLNCSLSDPGHMLMVFSSLLLLLVLVLFRADRDCLLSFLF